MLRPGHSRRGSQPGLPPLQEVGLSERDAALDVRYRPLFVSDDVTIAGHLARAPASEPRPGVVLMHGFPSGPGGVKAVLRGFPELSDRIAQAMGWTALCFAFRGCGPSGGSFSLAGWLEDAVAAVGWLADQQRPDGVWLVGFGTGGAIAVCAAARRVDVRGVAACGSPADFDEWAAHPRRVLEHARELGLVRETGFPQAFDSWARAFREVRAVRCAREIRDRAMLVLHGADDDLVPSLDARLLAEEHGSAELRIVEGAGHGLRHDPRAVAILLGWLARQHGTWPSPGWE